MTKNPTIRAEYKEAIYTKNHWALLSNLREKTKKMLLTFEKSHLTAIVHGSIARGNVNKLSDIDIVIPELNP